MAKHAKRPRMPFHRHWAPLVIGWAALSACTAGSVGLSTGPSPVKPEPAYLDSFPRWIPAPLLGRYTCLNGRPLTCQCTGMIKADCLCQCPF